MQVDKQSFGEGEGKKRFFLGVGDGDVQEERIYMLCSQIGFTSVINTCLNI